MTCNRASLRARAQALALPASAGSLLLCATTAFLSVIAVPSWAQDDLNACALLHQVLPSVGSGFADWKGTKQEGKSSPYFARYDGKANPTAGADCVVSIFAEGDKPSYSCAYWHVPAYDRASADYHRTIDAVHNCYPAWTSSETYESKIGVLRTEWAQPDFNIDVFLDDTHDAMAKLSGEPETYNDYKVIISIDEK